MSKNIKNYIDLFSERVSKPWVVDGAIKGTVLHVDGLAGNIYIVNKKPEKDIKMYVGLCYTDYFIYSLNCRAIQLVQNRLLRVLNGTKLKDRVSTESLLTKFNVISVNRLNAQVKLLEGWKALNIEQYPLKIKQQTSNVSTMTTRASTKGRPIEIGRSNVLQSTSTSDTIRVWNLAPVSITESKSLYQVKNAIKEYIKTIPI